MPFTFPAEGDPNPTGIESPRLDRPCSPREPGQPSTGLDYYGVRRLHPID
jgi:hypothetical protein